MRQFEFSREQNHSSADLSCWNVKRYHIFGAYVIATRRGAKANHKWDGLQGPEELCAVRMVVAHL